MKRLSFLAAGLFVGTLSTSAAAVGTIADVVIYDRAQNRTLPVHIHEGRHYVVGHPGNEYEIRLRNRQRADILTVVSVDGVDVVTGDTADWQHSGYVLGPQQGFGVKGWRKSLERTAAFYFTALPDSYAARTGRPDHVGVIGVAVFRKKPEPVVQYTPPHVARNSAAEAAAPSAMADDRGPACHLACRSPGPCSPEIRPPRYRPRPQRNLGGDLHRIRTRHRHAGRDHHHLLRQSAQPDGAGRDSCAFAGTVESCPAAIPGAFCARSALSSAKLLL